MSNYYISITDGAFGQGFSHLRRIEDELAIEFSGMVATKRGFVQVTSYLFKSMSYTDTTMLEIILDGRVYYGRIRKAYSKRYLATIARRFAEECAELAF